MAKSILTDCRIFTGGADLSSHSNKIELDAQSESKDVTDFESGGWTEVLGGLKMASFSGSGQWEAGDAGKVDDVSWADLGGLTGWTVCPSLATVGSLAYTTKVLRGKYKLLDAVGEVAPWEAEGMSAWPLARGKILHPTGTAITATGTGTAVELAAVSSTQQLIASLHVLSVSGTSTPTLTVTVQSDVDGAFASPATAISFSAATAISGQVQRILGPVTDTFFRISYTVSGTDPSFLAVVSLGIA